MSWKLGHCRWAAPPRLKAGPLSQMAWTRSRDDGCTSCTVAGRGAAASTRPVRMKMPSSIHGEVVLEGNGTLALVAGRPPVVTRLNHQMTPSPRESQV